MTWDPIRIYTPGQLKRFLDMARSSLDWNDLEEARDFLDSIRRSFPPDWTKIVREEFWIMPPRNAPEHWPLHNLTAHITTPGCGPWDELEAEVRKQAEMLIEYALPKLKEIVMDARKKKPQQSRYSNQRDLLPVFHTSVG